VFGRYSGADGFLFLQDHMILNYWNLLQADKEKLWITNKVCRSDQGTGQTLVVVITWKMHMFLSMG
jgi:hypothetical protein